MSEGEWLLIIILSVIFIIVWVIINVNIFIEEVPLTKRGNKIFCLAFLIRYIIDISFDKEIKDDRT